MLGSPATEALNVKGVVDAAHFAFWKQLLVAGSIGIVEGVHFLDAAGQVSVYETAIQKVVQLAVKGVGDRIIDGCVSTKNNGRQTFVLQQKAHDKTFDEFVLAVNDVVALQSFA